MLTWLLKNSLRTQLVGNSAPKKLVFDGRISCQFGTCFYINYENMNCYSVKAHFGQCFFGDLIVDNLIKRWFLMKKALNNTWHLSLISSWAVCQTLYARSLFIIWRRFYWDRYTEGAFVNLNTADEMNQLFHMRSKV